MLQLSKIIAKALKDDAAVSTIVGTKVYPLIADQDTEAPFVVYNVSQLPEVTKDNANDYAIDILSYHKTYDEALELNEKVIAVMQTINGVEYNGKKYKFRNDGAIPFLDQDNQIYVKQSLNIKK